MELNQQDDSILVVGLDPGDLRIRAGKIAMALVFIPPFLSLVAIPSPWFIFWISLPLSILLTCGQQYVLDGPADVLKKRRLYFFQHTEWTILGPLSQIKSIERRKPSSDGDGGEPLNSWIDFHFKDRATHTWSLSFGPSDVYRDQINEFLVRMVQKNGQQGEPSGVISVPLNDEVQSKPVPSPSNVWDKPAQTAPSHPAPSSVWETSVKEAPAADKPSSSVWDQ